MHHSLRILRINLLAFPYNLQNLRVFFKHLHNLFSGSPLFERFCFSFIRTILERVLKITSSYEVMIPLGNIIVFNEKVILKTARISKSKTITKR